MDLLIVEPLEDDVIAWLEARFTLRLAPELANDLRGFRQRLRQVRAVIVPPSVTIDAQTLQWAPRLRAVGRVSTGPESIDLDACSRARVEVVRGSASAQAEAEFMIGAVLSLLRRVPVTGSDGLPVGREIAAATVGLIGMAPTARWMAQFLSGFGSTVLGYDPSLHASDGVFARWRVRPVGLRQLLEQSDAVCVQLNYFSRYHGVIGERLLPCCKPDQVIVSIAHSSLFDEAALAHALVHGPLAAAWLDSLEPGALDVGRPLHGIDNLQITPRIASTTRESRLRSAWAVARRIDELLNAEPSAAGGSSAFRTTAPGGPTDLADGPRLP